MRKFHNSKVLLNSESFTIKFTINGKAVRNYNSIKMVQEVKLLSKNGIDYRLKVNVPCTAMIGTEEVSLKKDDIIECRLDNSSFYNVECFRLNPIKRHKRTVMKRNLNKLFAVNFEINKTEYHLHYKNKTQKRLVLDGYGKTSKETFDDDWQFLDRDL